jgi:erythromycin esterase-like protein
MQRTYRTREDARHVVGRLRRGVFLLVASTAAIALLSAAGDNGEAWVAWLDEHVVLLAGCEAGQGFDDLAPLAAMIGDARIVGLGESTHGTREHFQMKHRLVEYLVEELGFSWFAIEASTPEAHRLDAYVLGGDGDPEALIRGMYFWTWTTEEVLAMVEWMRAHNARSDQKIHFTGFDMQTPNFAAAEVTRFLREVESPLADRAAEQYPDIVQFTGRSPGGMAAYHFPTSQARGKTVRFTAWIKTEDVFDGCAGLWCRIDGPEGLLSSAYASECGVSGTTDWIECVIELPVAAEATDLRYGFALIGDGTAWFDSAAIELDGVPFDASSFDLAFEKVGIAAYFTSDIDYTVQLDRSVAHTGSQSLRIASLPRDPHAHDPVAQAEAILAEMQSERATWLTLHPAHDVERALLNARIVVQYVRMKDDPYENSRDEAMAENVAWLAHQYPEERLILWAHNGHVGRAPGMMGAHLADRFGDDYLPVGFATASGEYYAVGMDGETVHDLQAPPGESFEAHFAAATAPTFVLDLRQVEPENVGSAWLAETRPFRSVGSLARDEQFYPTPLRDFYDLIVFVEETTPARQL